MSTRDLCMFSYKLYFPTWFPYACIVSSREEGGFAVLLLLASISGSLIATWCILLLYGVTSWKLSISRISLWGCHYALTSQLNLFILFPDVTTTHNVHEEKMTNGQQAPDNSLSAVPPGCINLSGAGISCRSTRDLCMFVYWLYCPTWFPYACIVSCREEGGFVVLSYSNLVWGVLDHHLVYPLASWDNSLETGHQRDILWGWPNALISQLNFFIWIPDATVIHDIQEEEMENDQTPPDGFLSNSDSPELINMTGHRMPPNALDSFSHDFTSLSKDELLYKPDSNEFAVGTKNYSVSAGDPPVTAMSSVETVPNTPQISPAMAKKINDDIKYQLMKEVRRFGQSKYCKNVYQWKHEKCLILWFRTELSCLLSSLFGWIGSIYNLAWLYFNFTENC